MTGSSQEAAWSARRCYEYFYSEAEGTFASIGLKEPNTKQVREHPQVQRELERQAHLMQTLRENAVAADPKKVM